MKIRVDAKAQIRGFHDVAAKLSPGQILEDTRKEQEGLGIGGHTAEQMEYGTEWHRSSTNVCAPCGEGLTTVKPVHLAL